MARRTPHFDTHVAAGAKMVEFGGWEMPISYGSQLEEHHQVRSAAGIFDISHMTIVDLSGDRVREFLSRLLANDVEKLQQPGKALYSCMLNERGGVVDDLITYFVDQRLFRMVVNAATREKDLEWIRRHAGAFGVVVHEHLELAMIAVQGPTAREAVLGVLPPEAAEQAAALPRFFAVQLGDLFVARTGYTGEDGFEICLPDAAAQSLWDRLVAAGVRPCGLGARDTLRLEAGMNLYGQDMDEDVSPFESALGWTVAMDGERQFIGRAALERQRAAGVPRKLVGLVLEARGVLRTGQRVVTAAGDGAVTSGSFSPTLQRAIGLARVPAEAAGECQVEIRGKLLTARFVRPPFVRNGRACEGIL
ncbi:MAG: glycine cleavage system aminomethyltransferase GcvT [Xanthomonadales bacterium]|nr:glycine cleavage system aminomethyltransferase GcvT [Xanthomonadales bacterium]NIN60076.1 glycine cleavage system aminomethyltransferase GcvT [Xanthomonadales bacterium]NIN75446.1 glycine cleavage system aminomethyltransferase GcvT [Xanthomonadales bacterium]NIO13542.1 glycine cleavage system aminomethyltransferase GcvT [Xanthomonadales bacterium]NIP12469.1 glycine cleavage system aminomethyltransferase GcvT [Xanthomonadales bacterium]